MAELNKLTELTEELAERIEQRGLTEADLVEFQLRYALILLGD